MIDPTDLGGGGLRHDEGNISAMLPPPPDETDQRKLQQLASVSINRIRRIQMLSASGEDYGSLSRQFHLPVSLIVIIVENPQLIHDVKTGPMTLGGQPGETAGTHRPGVSPNPPPIQPVPGRG